ncbi:HYD1 signature containing ADP-ribosyltransferase family protein [Microbulbifer sp. DLAB2-AA]|uniref:HYD1 signature containing ADP-ribosyltransferase family protein n=1 Tax=Microbulbifer sp. DLAB2-AA TaxID=3243394 RepID=UPI004039706F
MGNFKVYGIVKYLIALLFLLNVVVAHAIDYLNGPDQSASGTYTLKVDWTHIDKAQIKEYKKGVGQLRKLELTHGNHVEAKRYSDGIYTYETSVYLSNETDLGWPVTDHDVVEVLRPPSSPTSVTISQTSGNLGNKIKLIWAGVSNADYYDVEFRVNAGPWQDLAEVDIGEPNELEDELQYIGRVEYQVKACRFSPYGTGKYACSGGQVTDEVVVSEGSGSGSHFVDFPIDRYGYAVFSGDFNNDGLQDYHFYSRERLLILHGDIATPITLSPNPAFSIYHWDNGIFSPFHLLRHESVSNIALSDAAQLKEGVDYFVGDFDGDGKVDFLFRGQMAGERPFIVYGVNQFSYPAEVDSFPVDAELTKLINDRSNTIYIDRIDNNGSDDLVIKSGNKYLADTAYLSVAGIPKTKRNLIEPDTKSVNLAGTLSGAAAVSPSGAATYSLPLALPPGSSGHAPDLTLNYSSQGQNGAMGLGWGFSGLSVIRYCHRTLVHDGGEVLLGEKDRFCVDGQRLVLTGGSYGGVNSTYASEIDSFRKFVAIGNGHNDITGFRVTTKGGETALYSINKGRDSYVLSELYDSSGNNLIKYSYIEDTNGFRIDKIEYAFGVGSKANALVKFEYEGRPDPVPENLMVGDYSLKVRLSKIAVTNNGSPFREYNINYLLRPVESENPLLSRLHSVQECVGSDCTAATTFGWNVVDAPGFASTKYTTMKFHSNANRFQPGRVADVNGDGKDDFIWFYKNSDEERYLQVALSDGEKWVVQETNHSIRAYYYLRVDWNLIDYNGDGKLDIIHRQKDNSWAVRTFNGSQFSSTPITVIPAKAGNQSVLTDITGDGLGDLVLRHTDINGISFYYAKRNDQGIITYPDKPSKSLGFSQPLDSTICGYDVGNLHAMEVIDKNGDGLTEFLLPYSAERGCSSKKKTYRDWQTITLASKSLSPNAFNEVNTHNYYWRPSDLNRDGLTDMLFKDEKDNWSYALSNDGELSDYIALPEIDVKSIYFVDYNHDGYVDIVWPGSNLRVKLWNGSGFDKVIETNIPAGTGHSIHPMFADMNGDGFHEYVRIYDGTSNHYVDFYAPNAGLTANNVIKNVSDGNGKKSTFTYKPLTDSSVYSKGVGASKLNWGSPAFDIFGSSYVVSQIEFSMPTAANKSNTEKVTYNYKGLRFQGGGRGNLGFEKITTTDSRTGYSVTTFAQEFPYTGMPLNVRKYSPQGKLLYSQDNKLNKRGGTSAPYWPYVETSTANFYLLKNNGASAGAHYKTVVTKSDYDDFGNLEESTVTTKNASGQVVQTVKQENGFDGQSWYREKGRVTNTKITTTRGNDVETREVSFEYYDSGSKYGLLKAEHIEPKYSGSDADAIKLTTAHTYDDYANRLTTTKTAAGEPTRITRSEYDAQKRYINKVRDADNRLLSEVISRNNMGLPTETRAYLDAYGASYVTTRIEYDALGREIYRVSDSAPWVRTEYKTCTSSSCSLGAAKSYVVTTSETGAHSTVYFDMQGRQLRQESTGLTQNQIIVTDTEYDDMGRVERQSEPYIKGSTAQYWTVNQYDINSRVTSVKLPDDKKVVHSEPVLASNLVVSTGTNPGGQKRTEKTNALGETVYVQDHYQGTVEYRYDAVGNVKDVVSHGRSGENLGITISAKYDARGRKIFMSDPDKGDWIYSYNAFGDLLVQEDGKGQRVVTQYDRYARPLRRTDYLSSGKEEGHTRWYYDDKDSAGQTVANALGKATAVVMSASANDEQCYAGSTHYCAVYEYKHVAGLQTSVGVAVGAVGSEESFFSSTGYDRFGRPEYQYDALNGEVLNDSNKITSGIREHYTNTGALEFVSDLNTGREVYRVIGSNSRSQVTDFDINSGKVRVKNGYDAATGRLLSQKADNSAQASTVQQMAYTWDSVGNLVSRNNQRSGKKESFCYDHLNRLLRVNSGTTSTASCNPNATGTQYQYDSIGNILSKDGVAYLYKSTKPHAVTSAGAVDYAYNDNNGNLTSDGTGRVFNYTTFDKPSLISNKQSGDSTAFTYGPERARYKRVDNRSDGEVLTTLYLGGVERIHQKSDGKYRWKRYLPGGAVFTYVTDAAYKQESLTERYLLTDHIGSTDVVLDANGNILQSQSMAFDPWGKRRDTNWKSLEISDLVGGDYQLLDSLNDVTTRGFTGHEMVDALGIIHMNGRIYDPNLGRFLQADPMIDGVKDTQGYNRYSYVKGNPLTLTDPTGYYSWGDFKKDVKELWYDACGDGCGVSGNSNGDIGFYAGQTNPDHQGFWAPQGASGAEAPEGASSATFSGESKADANGGYYEYSSASDYQNGGGFEGQISALSFMHMQITQDEYDAYQDYLFRNYQDDATIAYYSKNESYAVLPAIPVILAFIGKELAAEGLSRATNGATDFLSIRRVGTKGGKVAYKYFSKQIDGAAVTKGPEKLYHYTDNKGLDGITSSNKLNPSLKANNPNDARYGDGQYLSDIAPGSKTCAQLSRCFFGNPFQGRKVENYIEIDVRGLNVQKGRDGVYVVPGDKPLDLTNRITGSGKN